MRNRKYLTLTITFIFMIFTNVSFAEDKFTINQVAYLKVNKNRIFIYEYSGLPTDKDMAQYFLIDEKPMHTDGRFTAAYIWPKDNKKPLNGFNTFKSIDAANAFLYDSDLIDKWEFAYMNGFDGNAYLVSCLSSPDHELCRK